MRAEIREMERRDREEEYTEADYQTWLRVRGVHEKERGSMMSVFQTYRLKLVKESEGLYLSDDLANTPQRARDIILEVLDLESEPSEVFGILCLNVKNRVIGIHKLYVGTLVEAKVSPREIFQAALNNNAARIICFHNHPSGDPSPSSEDIAATRVIAEAGEVLGIELLDHVVIGHGSYASIKEMGYI